MKTRDEISLSIIGEGDNMNLLKREQVSAEEKSDTYSSIGAVREVVGIVIYYTLID
jgi:hypothetical protein